MRDSDFAADLAQVLRGQAPPEYADPSLFFANTHPTRGLRALLENVLRRVSGTGGEASPIFRLDTSYGGGKTHALIALSHIVGGRAKAEDIGEFVDPGLLPQGTVQVAAFDGENADPLNGRLMTGGGRAFTPWGELAFALGGAPAYETVRRSDEQRVAPGAETLSRLFAGKPTLILLDELSVYLRKVLKRADKDQLAPFLTSLFAAVASSPGAAVVFTLAINKTSKATDAYIAENQTLARLIDELESIVGRKATLLDPTGEEETGQVLRRRLFAKIDDKGATEVVNAYRALWTTNASALPKLRLREDRAAALGASYPLHPELMSVLTDKVSTLANFQRVRGMLRLLAQTVAELWTTRPGGTYAIHPHHLDPGYEPIKREIVTRLELANFEPAIRNDVSGGQSASSIAQGIDGQHFGGMPPYASQVARTILWHTFALNDQLKGASAEDIRYAVVAPETDISFIEDARQRFVAASEYLDDRPGVNHRFLADANLKKYVRRLEQDVDLELMRADVDRRIKSTFGGKALSLCAFPAGPENVEDAGAERPILVVPSYDAATISPDALHIPEIVARIFKQQGSQGAPRQFVNNLVFLVADDLGREEMKSRAVTRRALDTLKASARFQDLPEHQRSWVREELGKAETNLAVAIQTCYRHLFFPSRNHAIEGAGIPLGHASIETHTAAERPGEGQQQVLKTLREASKIIGSGEDPPSPRFVRDKTPALTRAPMSTADLRAEFRRNPTLWMLLGDDPFIALVRKGLQERVFVYQSGELLVGPGDPPAEVKIDAQSVLMTLEYASEHEIWPRPAKDDVSGAVVGGAVAPPTGLSSSTGGLSVGGAIQPSAGTIVDLFAGVREGRRPFEYEAPLKESLVRIWEMTRRAGVKRVVRLELTIFGPGDGFRLLSSVGGLSLLQKTVRLEAMYETAEGSSVRMELNGTVSDAELVKEHLEPQFRAAKEKSMTATFSLTFKDGLDLASKDPEALTDKLTRFASDSAVVKAYAEATVETTAGTSR
jgi:hypothetical protein